MKCPAHGHNTWPRMDRDIAIKGPNAIPKMLLQNYPKFIVPNKEEALPSQLTNVQSTKSEAAATVRKKSVSCFTPICVNTVDACL